MTIKIGDCPRCGRKEVRMTRGVCHSICYRRYIWKRKKSICLRCKKEKFIKARGHCGGCYSSIFRLQIIKDYNHQKRHNITPELYKKITTSCLLCSFSKVVELHHVDCNRHNSEEKNLIGLCPNHHKMIHTLEYGDFLKDVVERFIILKKYKPELFTPNTLNQKEEPLSIIQEELEEEGLPACEQTTENQTNNNITLPILIKTS